jgi:hypothetical protein
MRFLWPCRTAFASRGTMPDGTEMVAINARCLDSVDVFALNPTQFDGRSS